MPAPVSLWLALLAGHAIVAGTPLPAAWEEPARAAACVLGALSLLAAWSGRRYRARVLASVLLARIELLCGLAALAAAGGALAGEADRSNVPLPVHPRAVPVVVEGRVLDAVATDAARPTITLQADSIGVGAARAGCDAILLVRFGGDGPAPAWAAPGLSIRFQGRYRPLEDARTHRHRRQS